jgi:hypothetical protein
MDTGLLATMSNPYKNEFFTGERPPFSTNQWNPFTEFQVLPSELFGENLNP